MAGHAATMRYVFAVESTMTTTMTREDVLLLIAAGADGPYGLDPVRMMKGAFLASQKGLPEWRELFEFRPYSYGPFDRGVYASRDRLIRDGFLQADSSGRYERYSLTDAGAERVAVLREEVGDRIADWLAAIGRYVSSKPFASLLREVYAEYPDYASQSVFTG